MKRQAAGAPGTKRKTCGLTGDRFILLGGHYVTVPEGVKSADIDLIAANGDETWIDWTDTPWGAVGVPRTRKASCES